MRRATNAVPQPSPTPPRVYSYIRFSTPEQSRGDSLRRQAALAAAWAERNGYELDESLSLHDVGISAFRGANVAEGGALYAFLNAAREGLVPQGSILFVENLDRISRQTIRIARNTLESILDAGIDVVAGDRHFSKETYDRDPTAMIIVLLDFARANSESDVKSDRIRQAWIAKRAGAREGKPLVFAGRFPAWLRREGTSFSLIPERVEIVKRIFNAAKRGIGIESICRTLNTEGVLPFGPAAHWGRTSVDRLLNNPAVVGILQPYEIVSAGSGRKRTRQPTGKPIEGYYPAIISPKLFSVVQALRGARSTVPASRAVQNIFGALLKCAACGGGMTRASKGANGGRAKLICRTAHSGGACRQRARVPYDDFEQIALDALPVLLAEAPLTASGELEEQAEAIASHMEALDDSIERLLIALERGGQSVSITRRLAALEAEKASLTAKRKELDTEIVRLGNPLLLRQIHRLSDGGLLAYPVPPAKRGEMAQRLRSVIDSITLDTRTGQATVTWRAGGGSEAAFRFAFPDD